MIHVSVLTSLPTVLFMSKNRSTRSRMSLAAFALENSSIIPLVVCINSPSSAFQIKKCNHEIYE